MIDKSEYYIIFQTGKTHWITRWLKKGYSHILVVTHDDQNWIVYNPTRAMLQTMIPPFGLNLNPLEFFVQPEDKVLLIKFNERSELRQYGCLGPLNCVTWAKYILGLRLWSLTPYRLYKRLLNFSTRDYITHAVDKIRMIQ